MPEIARTRRLVKKHSFSYKKSYGQHFLIDERVKQKIIDACSPAKDDLVIEIGPGAGSLTKSLAELAGKVCAIEIDAKLIPLLTETLAGCENVTVINGDALKADIMGIIAGSGMKRAKVAANLPYNIATAVIAGFLQKRYPLESMTVMVQKEVAERLTASPGGKNYGSLSIFANYYCETSLVANVPVNAFVPRPGVDSAVVKLVLRSEPPVSLGSDGDEDLFFKMVRAAFSHRRKTLINCLTVGGAIKINSSKEELAEIFDTLGINAQIRGEALGLAEFAGIFGALKEGGHIYG